jgi:hypothetical protein
VPSLEELMKQYNDAVQRGDWDACPDLEKEIMDLNKSFQDMLRIYHWRIKESCEVAEDIFDLVYDDGHAEYGYNRGHYHIEMVMGYASAFFGQYDIELLIKEILKYNLDMYASYKGGHFHIFEDSETMDDVVSRLNTLFRDSDKPARSRA